MAQEAPVQTIADIARLAGVSKSTVSRALNDSPLIGVETKDRIREIAREHRFHMNDPARRLSLKQSNVVALVTYEYKADLSVPDAFMLEIMSGITAGLHANGYDLLVIQVAPNDTDWVRTYLESGRADGFILMAASCTKRHIAALTEREAPFILWGIPPGTHGYCSVGGDSFAGGKTATEHLLRTGRSRIAFVGGYAGASEVQDRLKGYEAALREAGQEVDPKLVAYGDFSERSGAAAMAALLERAGDIDAVFVNSDRMAIAAMDEIRAQRAGRSRRHRRRRLRRRVDRAAQRSAADHDPPGRAAGGPAAGAEPRPAPRHRGDHERLDPGRARRAEVRMSALFVYPCLQPVAKRRSHTCSIRPPRS